MKIVMIVLMFFSFFGLDAQTLQMTDETSEITFESRQFGGKLEGTVKGVKGTAIFDTTDLAKSIFRFSFASSTFIHNDIYIGPDLTRASCFDVKKNPTIDLVSSSITKIKGVNQYQFTGALIIKGMSRNLTFPMTITPNVGGFDFSFAFPIEKKKYKLDCGFRKKMTLKVKTYAKRKLPEAGDV